MSLLDIIKPPPAIAVSGRIRRLSNRPPEKRVHRIAPPEEDHDLPLADALPPRPVSFQTVTPDIPINKAREGETMPTGVYERKKKAVGEQAGAGDGAASKKRKRSAAQKASKPARAVGEATFAVDDRGRMVIRDGQQMIELEADDVKRLTEFLDRTKTVRK